MDGHPERFEDTGQMPGDGADAQYDRHAVVQYPGQKPFPHMVPLVSCKPADLPIHGHHVKNRNLRHLGSVNAPAVGQQNVGPRLEQVGQVIGAGYAALNPFELSARRKTLRRQPSADGKQDFGGRKILRRRIAVGRQKKIDVRKKWRKMAAIKVRLGIDDQ